jgi:dTDP-4-dehydrorhamnose reductase
MVAPLRRTERRHTQRHQSTHIHVPRPRVKAAKVAQDYQIIRTAWLYGEGGRNFVRTMAEALRRGGRIRVVNDQIGSPTWTRDLASAAIKLMQNAPIGTYHVTQHGERVLAWIGSADRGTNRR